MCLFFTLIIDEYDYPLLDSIGEPYFDDIRKDLENFFTVLKAKEDDIKFLFITGVTRFSQLSLFSKLNNLIDLSEKEEYASICGYTDGELDINFSPYFDEYYEKEGIADAQAKEAFRRKVKEYYDGYRFSKDSDVSVYNPVSIGSFFNSGCKFENYWVDTGSRTLIKKLVEIHTPLFEGKQEFKMIPDENKVFDPDEIFNRNAVPDVVYSYFLQAGYLTIKEIDEDGFAVLSYPNREVSVTMSVRVLAALNLKVTNKMLSNIGVALHEENTETLISDKKVFVPCTP